MYKLPIKRYRAKVRSGLRRISDLAPFMFSRSPRFPKFTDMKQVLLLLACCLSCSLYAQLTVQVVQIPASTPAGSELYLAGNMNGWQPDDDNYILQLIDGVYTLTIDPPAGTLLFKFTRGSWPTVEGNSDNQFLPDRSFSYDGTPTTYTTTIEGWEDAGDGGANSTAAANVEIMDENFYMPQLDRNRRIWLYLPPDYHTTDKTYPVIYMHDAQNLFDQETSFSGEWEVDETLNQLHAAGDHGAIVVGIENGGVHRLDELTPWSNPQYGGGQGAQYINFIVETLKPHIDQQYRTRPEREFTAIAGSSLGGLVSMYAIMAHPTVFGKAGVLSPSFWFSQQAYTQVAAVSKDEDVRIYLMGGANEGGNMVQKLQEMESTLESSGFVDEEDFTVVVHGDGQHSEWYWAREFGSVYEWLFAETVVSTGEPQPGASLRVYPNPVDSVLQLSAPADLLRLFDASGRLWVQEVKTDRLNVGQLHPGTYFLETIQAGIPREPLKIIVR